MSRGRLLLNAGTAAFVALMLARPGAAVLPGTFRWAAWAACPAGWQPTPRRFRESYNRRERRRWASTVSRPTARRATGLSRRWAGCG
jgi:hypothetical protein